MNQVDKMWLYKHPQGLKALESELDQLRKRRYNRSNRFKREQDISSKETSKTIIETSKHTLSTFEPRSQKDTLEQREVQDKKIHPTFIQIPKPCTIDKEESKVNSSNKVYLPQLSPELKFTEPEGSIEPTKQRPPTKKRVSFNEQLTFIIPTYEEPREEQTEINERKPERMEPTRPVIERYAPHQSIQRREQKKEPQRLPNRLLDIFQPKRDIKSM
ncbi:unnamed protein product [Rhizopus microsporus]|uniref:Uncharacterized protein n=1 Tax=Rhizopus microsporus TaxID=58291 RepID=A0A1X0S8F8_RHIZD|nr:hypothetical protein BCV71DRAFT_225600 [Rhizopus microsporus]